MVWSLAPGMAQNGWNRARQRKGATRPWHADGGSRRPREATLSIGLGVLVLVISAKGKAAALAVRRCEEGRGGPDLGGPKAEERFPVMI